MVRELGVELARDPEIVGHDPSKFHLSAVGRQLFLASDHCAGQIFRVTTVEFPFGEALSRGARRHTKKYQYCEYDSVQFSFPPNLDKSKWFCPYHSAGEFLVSQ